MNMRSMHVKNICRIWKHNIFKTYKKSIPEPQTNSKPNYRPKNTIPPHKLGEIAP